MEKQAVDHNLYLQIWECYFCLWLYLFIQINYISELFYKRKYIQIFYRQYLWSFWKQFMNDERSKSKISSWMTKENYIW